MSELLPTINGNILTVYVAGFTSLASKVRKLRPQQFTVTVLDEELGSMAISMPITKDLENIIPGVIREARSRNGNGPKNPDGGGDGTPPSGGTPGTPVLDTYTYTEARAA